MSQSPDVSPLPGPPQHRDHTRPDRRRSSHRPRPTGPTRSPGEHVPVFPESRLTIEPWPDPVLDAMGHDPRSAYVEQFWLAIIGPSSLLLLRRLANRLEYEPAGFEIDPRQWAAELGLGARGGQHGPFWRSVERACRFGLARRAGPAVSVRRRLPPLTSRQVLRLPEHLRPVHDQWQAAQLERPRRRTITHWSDHGQVPDPPEPPQADPGTGEVR